MQFEHAPTAATEKVVDLTAQIEALTRADSLTEEQVSFLLQSDHMRLVQRAIELFLRDNSPLPDALQDTGCILYCAHIRTTLILLARPCPTAQNRTSATPRAAAGSARPRVGRPVRPERLAARRRPPRPTRRDFVFIRGTVAGVRAISENAARLGRVWLRPCGPRRMEQLPDRCRSRASRDHVR